MGHGDVVKCQIEDDIRLSNGIVSAELWTAVAVRRLLHPSASRNDSLFTDLPRHINLR